MTELEEKIYKCALKALPDAKQRIKDFKTECRYVQFPFHCDGCLDYLIYDTKLKKFTKIKYTKGKGVGTFSGVMSDFSAYYNDIEHCEFDISEIV